ncbi:MAG: c-type cytochrome domain-containing protein, partial [Bacteroidota bacterium]
MRNFSAPVRSVALVAAVALLGCQQDLPIAPDYDNIRTIVYSRHVQPLFDQSCSSGGCHNSGSAAAGLKLDSWENVFRGSEHGASVIPFRSRKSHLIFHVNRDAAVAPVANPPMPPDRPLSPAEVRFLIRWIDEGAKNDAGDAPLERPRLGKVYVTNQADDEVAVIDIESQLLMRMVPVGALDNASTPPEA